jgi:hypothetical protein
MEVLKGIFLVWNISKDTTDFWLKLLSANERMMQVLKRNCLNIDY